MESCRYRTGRDGYHHQQHGHDPPSFSSTLLDSIYRSLDDSAPAPERRRSSTRPDARSSRDQVLHSASSSMDSADSWRRPLKAPTSHDTRSLYPSTKSNNNNNNKSLKPIRTSRSETSISEPVKRDGGRASGKSRAMKLYGELKRMKKQPPISPGAKLAAFLNSLFKKQRTSAPSSYTASTPTCSTASSSYSRSCLTKTPSSSARAKRSVRFSRPLEDHLASPMDKSSQEEVKRRAMDKNRRVEEAAMELLLIKNCNSKWESTAAKLDTLEMADAEDEDYNDAESCCSSDLFELDNLLHIGGVDRYCAELPVYESTRLHTNRAITTAFIL